MKTMIVHDEGESDAGSTPCKDSTLIVRQVVQTGGPTHRHPIIFRFSTMCCVLLCPPVPSVSFPFYVDVVFVAMESSSVSGSKFELCITVNFSVESNL